MRVRALATFACLVCATVWLAPAGAQPAAPPILGPHYGAILVRPRLIAYPVYADSPAFTAGAASSGFDGAPKWPASLQVVTVPVIAQPGPPTWPGVQPTPLAPAGVPTDEDQTAKLLTSPIERERVDAAVSLARDRSEKSVEALKRALANDASVRVRETAARVLGLIGSPAALDTLQVAAGNDKDRDVRDSARFAAELIRTKVGKP